MQTGVRKNAPRKDALEVTLTVMDMESVTLEQVNASATLDGKVRFVCK